MEEKDASQGGDGEVERKEVEKRGGGGVATA